MKLFHIIGILLLAMTIGFALNKRWLVIEQNYFNLSLHIYLLLKLNI